VPALFDQDGQSVFTAGESTMSVLLILFASAVLYETSRYYPLSGRKFTTGLTRYIAPRWLALAAVLLATLWELHQADAFSAVVTLLFWLGIGLPMVVLVVNHPRLLVLCAMPVLAMLGGYL